MCWIIGLIEMIPNTKYLPTASDILRSGENVPALALLEFHEVFQIKDEIYAPVPLTVGSLEPRNNQKCLDWSEDRLVPLLHCVENLD